MAVCLREDLEHFESLPSNDQRLVVVPGATQRYRIIHEGSGEVSQVRRTELLPFLLLAPFLDLMATDQQVQAGKLYRIFSQTRTEQARHLTLRLGRQARKGRFCQPRQLPRGLRGHRHDVVYAVGKLAYEGIHHNLVHVQALTGEPRQHGQGMAAHGLAGPLAQNRVKQLAGL